MVRVGIDPGSPCIEVNALALTLASLKKHENGEFINQLGTLISIYSYKFKCGVHYVAMFKFFQCIIFACLTNFFLHV